MKDYQTKIQEIRLLIKAAGSLLLSNFQNLPADYFSLALSAARSPEKDLVHQNLGEP